MHRSCKFATNRGGASLLVRLVSRAVHESFLFARRIFFTAPPPECRGPLRHRPRIRTIINYSLSTLRILSLGNIVSTATVAYTVLKCVHIQASYLSLSYFIYFLSWRNCNETQSHLGINKEFSDSDSDRWKVLQSATPKVKEQRFVFAVRWKSQHIDLSSPTTLPCTVYRILVMIRHLLGSWLGFSYHLPPPTPPRSVRYQPLDKMFP